MQIGPEWGLCTVLPSGVAASEAGFHTGIVAEGFWLRAPFLIGLASYGYDAKGGS